MCSLQVDLCPSFFRVLFWQIAVRVEMVGADGVVVCGKG